MEVGVGAAGVCEGDGILGVLDGGTKWAVAVGGKVGVGAKRDRKNMPTRRPRATTEKIPINMANAFL